MAALLPVVPDATWQALIVAEVGGGEPLAAVLAVYWASHAAWAGLPRLRYLLVRRDALYFQLGQLDETWNLEVEGDQQARLGSRRLVLSGLLARTQEEIVRAYKGRPPLLVQRPAQTLIPSPPTQPAAPVYGDAADSVYLGDPNKRPWPVVLP